MADDAPATRPPLASATLALGFLALAFATGAWAEEEIPGEKGEITKFIEGTNAMAFGVGEVPPIEVEGDPEEIRLKYPPEAVEREHPSEHVIVTRILASFFGSATVPLKGHVGDDPLLPHIYPSYRRGWQIGEGGGVQVGFDAGMVGFYLEVGFQVFESKGRIFDGTGAWFRYSHIRVLTLCPGFKLQFQNWLKYLYAGKTTWEVNWFDYMLHSFPYVKFGVGPIFAERLETWSDTTPKRDYWKRGLSYTFFITFGLEWRPFGRLLSCFLESGVQAFVFTTETAYSKSPDWLTCAPIKFGLSLNF